MSDKYFTVNIRAYLDKDEPTYIGEESLYDLLSDFSCPKNPDVEYFLLHNAIEFTKKDQYFGLRNTILYYRSLPDCPVGKELFSSKE